MISLALELGDDVIPQTQMSGGEGTAGIATGPGWHQVLPQSR